MKEENNIERIGKRLVFFGLLLFLFIPLIQNVTHFKKYIHPLDGAFYPEKDISLSAENWFNGEYQSQKDKFIKENFGFHNYYLRLIFQLNFSLFKATNVHNVVIGKDNYLYEIPYLNAYYGRDFIGEERIDSLSSKIKLVQDTLQKQNKIILTVFAPGKASFYPEYMPENYKSEKSRTNYEGLTEAMRAKGLYHIDFYKHFNEQKNVSKYPLYPQQGIHWSDYGSILAFDSITRYVENKLKVDLPDMEITGVEVSDSLRGTDNDAIKSLNLFIDPPTFKMAYPRWIVKYDSLRYKKLKLLVVADSFWWHIYSTLLPDKTYASSAFWYYNQEIYPESYSSSTLVSQVDYARRIREADVIILMHSEATLRKFSGGFVDMCYETFFTPSLRQEKLEEMRNKIRSSKEWYDQIIEKAGKRNITVDSMLTMDAIYMLEQERK